MTKKNQKHAAALGRWAQDMPSSQRHNTDTSTIDRRDAPQATLFTAALIVTPDTTSINLIRASRLMHVIDVRGHEVRRDDMLELVKPKQRDLREDLPLVGHTLILGIRRGKARSRGKPTATAI